MVRVLRTGTVQSGVARKNEDVADPVDIHVGRRLRQRRAFLGFSQEKLGRAVGLTFQQIQKYERGANRIGASRLLQLSRALAVPITYFFEDAPGSASRGVRGKMKAGPKGILTKTAKNIAEADPFSRRETLELVRAYYAISSPAVRRRVLDLVRSLAKPAP